MQRFRQQVCAVVMLIAGWMDGWDGQMGWTDGMDWIREKLLTHSPMVNSSFID